MARLAPRPHGKCGKLCSTNSGGAPLPGSKVGVSGEAAWFRDFAGGRFRLGDGTAPAALFLNRQKRADLISARAG